MGIFADGSGASRSNPVPIIKVTDDTIMPRLIGSFFASDFTDGKATKYFDGVLSRSARERTFIIKNRLSLATNVIRTCPYDSFVDEGRHRLTGSNYNIENVGNNNAVATYTTKNDKQGYGWLAANVDSIMFNIELVSGTLTGDSLDIYVVEVF